MKKPNKGREILNRLMDKGVSIPCPEGVEIGVDISPDRISGDGVVIHTGCKLYGRDTLIMAGAQLGYEAPATIHNCQIGRNVRLKGGYFHESVFQEKSSMGSGAQVRESCLLEEGVKGAHNVGLKHTILMPYVTLGSLINFCDCLMAGGTDEMNHSEVGSSYIHFNYTPNQDKATPSLLGDVPRGVMINRPPIFLGGQGGLVGPLMLEYGTVVAAGAIVRKDILKGNTMLLGHSSVSKSIPFRQGLYQNIKRIVKLNSIYIANLLALRRYYLDIRSLFLSGDDMERALHKGAVDKLDSAINERLKRLGDVAGRMPSSLEIHGKGAKTPPSRAIIGKKELIEKWPELEHTFRDSLSSDGDNAKRDRFLKTIEMALARDGKDYIRVIKGLGDEESKVGTSWLQGLVDDICKDVWSKIPGMNIK